MIPWSVQIELHSGCTRRCHQCGIWSLPKELENKSMSIELADSISKELNSWIPKGRRIEFALQGEPLLNPNAKEIIKTFRTNYSRSQLLISTNGDPLIHNGIVDIDYIKTLFNNGLNYLLWNNYDKDLSWFKDKFEFTPFEEFNVYQYRGNKDHKIVVMDNHSEEAWKNRRRFLNNQAGFVKPEYAKELGIPIITEPLKKRCSNVARELVIKADGSVPACCMMWKPDLIVGKFPEQSLEQIWNSQKFQYIRQLLYNKNRILSPCNKCSYSGFKCGLLKDPGIKKSVTELVDYVISEHPYQTQLRF